MSLSMLVAFRIGPQTGTWELEWNQEKNNAKNRGRTFDTAALNSLSIGSDDTSDDDSFDDKKIQESHSVSLQESDLQLFRSVYMNSEADGYLDHSEQFSFTIVQGK